MRSARCGACWNRGAIVSEKELGEALLRLDAATLAGVPDHKQQVWRVLERDRRRVRLLTWLTYAIWLVAEALVLSGLISYGFTFPMQAQLVKRIEEGKLTPRERDEMQRIILMSFQKGTLVIAFSVAVMATAALVTVLLIQTSRRATLRHANANLAEIAEQLRQLRQPPPRSPEAV
jgi:hypothetical protein